jgi:hypothetical protein
MDTPQPLARNDSMAVSATSDQMCNVVQGGYKRTMVIITNTSATAVVTVALGDLAAVAGSGIRLPPNGNWWQSSDSGLTCWQGQIQAVADAAGTVGIVEQLEPLK